MNDVEALCALIEDCVADPGGEPVRPDTPLLTSGMLDSLTILRIVARVEQEEGVSFPEAAVVAASFRTPATLWTVVEQLRAGADR